MSDHGPQFMFDDAVGLIRSVPGNPKDNQQAADEWVQRVGGIVAEYGDPVPLVLGLSVVARQLARFIAESGDATFDQVLDVVYSKVIEAGAADERNRRGDEEA